jgi:hypothetical protein
MVETGTGWPDHDRPDLYVKHANVKLTIEQLAYIEASTQATSTWIREAVEDRIEKETAEDSNARLKEKAKEILLSRNQP